MLKISCSNLGIIKLSILQGHQLDKLNDVMKTYKDDKMVIGIEILIGLVIGNYEYDI